MFKKHLLALLGLSLLATKDNKVDLTAEHEADLEASLGLEKKQQLIDQVNLELANVESVSTQLEAAKLAAETAKKDGEDKAATIAEVTKSLNDVSVVAQTQTAQLAEAAVTIAKLKDEPILNGEAVNAVSETAKNILGRVGIAATMLFAQGVYGSVDRPWNARAMNGISMATDFTNQVNIDRLYGDVQDFTRENPQVLHEIYNEYFDLPQLWKDQTIFGVKDVLTSAVITVGEVTQPRKAHWLPKGKVNIQAEEMRVRPAQIDLEFKYWELQALETNWLNSMFNREGTQAYKMTFIYYVLEKYAKKARAEDAEVLIRGVYVATPENYMHAVSYLHRNDGVLKLVFDAREAGKYRPFNMGTPTRANILDYIDEAIESLPEAIRKQPLQLVSGTHIPRWYKRRYEEVYGEKSDYTGYPKTPKDYENIQFVTDTRFNSSNLILITFLDNIKPLEFIPAEKDMWTIEKDRRDVYAFMDYRLGIGIQHIGMKVDASNPQKYSMQAIWTNNVALFEASFFANSYDDGTGILKAAHYNSQVVQDFTTDITNIESHAGKLLAIKGDISLAGNVKVKKNANLVLDTSDFDLKTGGTLTLIQTNDGKWKEVSRTTAPDALPTSKTFDTLNLFYAGANEFKYEGDAAGTLLTISDGENGNRVRIYGSENALTVADVAGKIDVASNAVLDSDTKFIDLVSVNGVWVEAGRG